MSGPELTHKSTANRVLGDLSCEVNGECSFTGELKVPALLKQTSGERSSLAPLPDRYGPPGVG